MADLLVRKQIESYCPMNRTVRQWADRKKTIYSPLFSSYVFVHINAADHLAIQQTTGILNFVYWLGRPALIKDEEIDAIRDFLHHHENVQLEKIQVNVADHIRILNGPLMYREGNVLEIKKHSVKVCLPSLGCAMTAEVPKNSIEILQPATAGVCRTA